MCLREKAAWGFEVTRALWQVEPLATLLRTMATQMDRARETILVHQMLTALEVAIWVFGRHGTRTIRLGIFQRLKTFSLLLKIPTTLKEKITCPCADFWRLQVVIKVMGMFWGLEAFTTTTRTICHLEVSTTILQVLATPEQ